MTAIVAGLGAFGWGVGLLAVAGVALVARSRIERAAGHGTRSIRLSHEHAVHVVEIGGRTLLVGTGPGGPPALLLELERHGGREHHGA